MKTLFFLAAAMSFTAFSQDWYQDISGAGFRQIRQNDTTALELSGRTKQQKNTNYFIGTIHLDKPLNLTGKQVRLKITTSTPGEIIALAVRFYNAGEKTPCWSFMKWGKVFDGTGAIAPALFPGQNKILAWEKAKVIKRKKGVVGPNYRDYVGPNPLSELESQSLANFTTLQQFNLTISLHSQGEEIYWDDRKWKN